MRAAHPVFAFVIVFGIAAAAVPLAHAQPEWQALPHAPVTTRIDDLHFIDALNGWICAGDGTIHRTGDGGASWTLQHDDPDLYFRSIRFADAQHGWAGTLNSASLLHATTNGGATWTLVPGIPEPRPNALCGLHAVSDQVVYGVGSYSGPARVIKTIDGGATWTSTDVAPLATTLVDVWFWNALEGLAVGSVGTFPSGSLSVVLRTEDGGATWQRRWLGARTREWGWKISFPAADTGFVSLERPVGPMYFLKTVDRGLTWNEHPCPNYNEQGIGFVTTSLGWIGGRSNPTIGTTDGGATWAATPWGSYLNRFQFLDPTLGYGAGVTVYKYASPTVDVPRDPAPPRAPAIAARPNPFGARTTIRFDLAAPAEVSLFVADPTGRLVRRLTRGPEGAGSYRFDWDGKDDEGREVPAGIYLYVLHAGDRHEMGKLVRVR